MECVTSYTGFNEKPTWVDYAIVTILIAATGFAWCCGCVELIFFAVFPLSVFLFFQRHKKIPHSFILYLVLIILWGFFQIINRQTVDSAIVNFTIRMSIYFLAALVIRDFPAVIRRTILIMTIVGLVFYFLSAIPPIRAFFFSISRNIEPIGVPISEKEDWSNPGQFMIIYFLPIRTWMDYYRNSGPFWEPGMFGVFINIALVLYVLNKRRLTWQCWVLIIASITTLSTGTYICSIFIISYYLIGITRKPSSLILLILLGIGLVAFLQSDFGLSKIQEDANSTETYSRFGAVLYHLKLISQHWLIGRGFASHESEVLMSPNGITMILLFWGLPYAVLYYIVFFKGCDSLNYYDNPKYNKITSWVIYIALLVVCFSQDVTVRHFYYTILAYGIVNLNNTKIIRHELR